jgi:hypothetical protein
MLKVTRRSLSSILAVVLMTAVAGWAGNLTIVPTTTLSVQTRENTSAADSFGSQPNGNLGGANVSKLDVHALLYPASETKVFAHLMLWFGQHDHMDVGYSSTDPEQVRRQISDMISRGLDGVVMVWYGPHNGIDRAAQLVMHEAELHPGFTFAIMLDNGAIRWNACHSCDSQDTLIDDLQYVEQTYFSSPAYLRVNGRPVVTNFDIDLYYKVDWRAAKTAMASDPLFLFQNGSGFSHEVSDGAYSWDSATTDYGMNYLTKFYGTGMGLPGKQTWGAAYKGFNDKLASWGLNRFMGQQCGQTWLQTFSKINSTFNSTNQLEAMQLVTWNDYEEGTEIESGIDNCVTVAAALSSNSLQWKVTGNDETIDHYTVYISSDDRNLMPLAERVTSSHSLDMCSYSLAAGDYTLFVQAVGKPMLTNQMSGAARYTPHCSSPEPPPASTASSSPSAPSSSAPSTSSSSNSPPSSSSPSTTSSSSSSASSSSSTSSASTTPAKPVTPPAPAPPKPLPPAPPAAPAFAVSASPSSVTIAGGQLGSPNISITAQSGPSASIRLSCSHLPVGMSCAFSPSVISSGSASTLKISVSRATNNSGRPPHKSPKGLIFGFAFGFMGIVMLGTVERKHILRGLMLGSLVAGGMMLSSCGGMINPVRPEVESAVTAPVVPGAYTIMVNADAGTVRTSTTANITIR